MSLLDQAKKEAKRLFNLAKANQEVSSMPNHIVIDSLSKSREILSIVNGYKNWHEYEEVLKRKDFVFGNIDKVSACQNNKAIIENQKYYTQDMAFNTITNPTVGYSKLVVEKEHRPIVLGRTKEKTLFEHKEKKWILNNYPVLITGSTGAGKTDTLCSISSQFIENNEGLIYFDGKADTSLYGKIFSYASKHNRLGDFYCLNFVGGMHSNHHNEEHANCGREQISHSIDPINPMVGDDKYFNTFFGRIGPVIHSILKELRLKNQLMDTKSLESTLMLHNLIMWRQHKKFESAELNEYLIEIGLPQDCTDDEEDLSEALLKHSNHAHVAFETIKLLKAYNHLFKLDCSVDMDRIFLERKILLVLLPALERSTVELAKVGSLIASQVKHIELKYQQYKTHFQNIIVDGFYYFAEDMSGIDFSQSKNNYIFGSDYADSNKIFDYVQNNACTRVIMKQCYPEIHNKIKLDLINNLEELPNLNWSGVGHNKSFISKFTDKLMQLRTGEAYVLSKNRSVSLQSDVLNSKEKYYCQYLMCEYIPTKYEKSIWLVEHPRPIIYISETQPC